MPTTDILTKSNDIIALHRSSASMTFRTAKSSGLTLPVIVTINELGWLLMLGLILGFSASDRRHRDELRSLEVRESATSAELERTRKALSDDNAKIDSLNLEILKLRREMQEISANWTRAKKNVNDLVAADQVLKRDIVGLKGPLSRVGLVVDQSRSMGSDKRWEHTRAIIETWIRYLPIENVALILFNDKVSVYPPDGTSLLSLKGTEGEANKEALIAELRRATPTGSTNTLAALQRAFDYTAIDTIILFSDGFPDRGKNQGFDDAMARSIYELCGRHPGIPINTVGLGDYFGKKFGAFLRKLPKDTGGTFIGR